MKWYEYKYINHRDWLLDNLEHLNLKTDELAVVLLIDYYNTNRMPINYKILSDKLHKEQNEIDEILVRLVAKNYLKINVKTNISFSLKPLFETTFEEQGIVSRDIFDKLEKMTGKLLSEVEANKLVELVKKYPEKEIDKAIEIANLHGKLSLTYIEGILKKNVA